ncbi:MAG TPA: hypothetical protein VIX63_14235 [Vicinamibacterales bacterium]
MTTSIITIEKDWDGNVCETEGANGRTYVSHGRWQWTVIANDVADRAFDTLREAREYARERYGVEARRVR